MNIQNNRLIDRIIQNYLEVLDSRPYNDAELCTELGEFYLVSHRPHIGFAFFALAARRSRRAAEACRLYDSQGDIAFPGLLPHPVMPVTAAVPGTLCTGANARFFPILLNMIGSAQLNSWRSIGKILVCDLGLLPKQVAFLEKLDRVQVTRTTWPLSFQAWKLPFILESLDKVPGPILYLDAGCYVERDLEDVFRIVEQRGHLFFYNGPYSDPIHLTQNWTSQRVYQYFGLQKHEDRTVTAITTLLGVSQQTRDFLAELVSHNDLLLLRPHADCLDNRYDQSLFSVFVQHVRKLELSRFEGFLRNSLGYGAAAPYITIHRSKVRPGETFASLRGRSETFELAQTAAPGEVELAGVSQ